MKSIFKLSAENVYLYEHNYSTNGPAKTCLYMEHRGSQRRRFSQISRSTDSLAVYQPRLVVMNQWHKAFVLVDCENAKSCKTVDTFIAPKSSVPTRSTKSPCWPICFNLQLDHGLIMNYRDGRPIDMRGS